MWGFRVRAPGGPPIRIAQIAQLARALAFQAGGHGFEPRFPLKKVKIASVAQWLECLLAKEKAVGSNPITRSNKIALVVQLNRTPVYGTGNQGLNPCRGTIQIFHAGFV